ncbi:zinc finger protein [Neurospora crassa OR74A]|uniref:Zinc finger protein n=1 Tax=Neurospora crassa (strain ATCC 24698 / 74-OR23-1A / CBS 708.71 / DSM 1257 / FGSC 987) TaxID=367110 RepID=Q7SH30_NEUCR|nr:zinc finger protein [Neurospora crassa OR74A]EAA36236.3 zinc finger protein [Neurospora crassa OR74A]|eukprot:XP_965472.3 zinc finger protein [Neurospora crassa OR74A]
MRPDHYDCRSDMDGHFGHRPANHNQTQSQTQSHNHGHHGSLDLRFQYLMDSSRQRHTPLSSDATHQISPSTANDGSRIPTNTTVGYESHDDLCVDHCEVLGLYQGGSQFPNHRGLTANSLGHWSRRYVNGQDALLDTPHVDLFAHNLPSNDFMPMQQFGAWSQWQGHQSQQSMQECGEDCQSNAEDSCCDSECAMTGKCTNIACANGEDVCVDQSCPERSMAFPSDLVDGAAALLSINHGSDMLTQSFNFSSMGGMNSMCGMGSMANLGNMNHMNDIGSMGNMNGMGGMSNINNMNGMNNPNHLNSLNGLNQNNDPQNYPNCHIPVSFNAAQFGQYSSVASNFEAGQALQQCGFEASDPEAYIRHFNTQHRPYFTNTEPSKSNNSNGQLALPNLIPGSGGVRSSRTLAATEALSSSPATPLDTSDSGASMNTPSPLTPVSEAKTRAQSPSHTRSSSADTSETSYSDNMDGDNDEHKCLWREDSGKLCAQTFTEAGDLFDHVSNVHIKHASKGNYGFLCAWDDCPRSHPGVHGFPQRSKIERHMQTHIGHKPHVCKICHKGFSAKQALTQHMYIHSDQKPLECNICFKTFRYPSALTMHMRVHSGEKPLQCPICGKKFSESSNLSKHKRTHEVKGRFNCNVRGCCRNFHRQDQLRRHMKTHQKDVVDGRVVDIYTSQLPLPADFDFPLKEGSADPTVFRDESAEIGDEGSH